MLTHRRTTFRLCLGLVAILSVLDHAGFFGHRAPDRQRYSNTEARVTKVDAFDTIEVDIPDGASPVTRVKLNGIVWFPPDENRPLSERFCDEALGFVKHNAVGKRVTLALDPARRVRDREGRILAYVYLTDSGEWLNQMLIERGLVDADRRTEHTLKFEFVQKAQRAAKAQAGWWAHASANQVAESPPSMDADEDE
jgi:endonuclease YncB( thermonuclease family)